MTVHTNISQKKKKETQKSIKPKKKKKVRKFVLPIPPPIEW